MFTIPDDLSVYSLEGLQDLRRVAFNELTSIRASATPDTITDEQLERAEALRDFVATADTEIGKRSARSNRFTALDDVPDAPPAVTAAGGNGSETDSGDDGGSESGTDESGGAEPAAVTADGGGGSTDNGSSGDSAGNSDNGQGGRTAPSVAQMAAGTSLPEGGQPEGFADHSIIAAADIPGFSTGSELTSWLDVGKAFVNRTRGYKGKAPTQHSVVEIRREFAPEFTFTREESRNPELVLQKMRHVTDEKRLEGGSLVAANGWCAPSENLYTTCNQISTDGLVSLPEVSAPRGGINHNQGIEFDTVFGDGTGFTILTEDEVISGVQKTCVEIPCPDFVDDRLKVAALCLTGSILQNRAYPEFVSEFIQGAMGVFSHFVNRQIIADVVAGSDAVDLTGSLPWSSDSSVASQTLAAVEHAATDIRYRLRLPRTASLEVWLPDWIRAQYRADVSRRNGSQVEFALTDAMLANWFSIRGLRPQYLYDWQDAFADSGVGYGADTALQTVPTSVDFVIYPAGTWALARLDVIRLDSVYDSVQLPQNLVTQLFMEDGFKAMRMCPLSRVYTVPICPTGATSDVQTVTCGS